VVSASVITTPPQLLQRYSLVSFGAKFLEIKSSEKCSILSLRPQYLHDNIPDSLSNCISLAQFGHVYCNTMHIYHLHLQSFTYCIYIILNKYVSIFLFYVYFKQKHTQFSEKRQEKLRNIRSEQNSMRLIGWITIL